MYCLDLKGFKTGEIVLGNSVHSLGFMAGLSAGLRTVVGGEVTQITEVISQGRHEAQTRLEAEAAKHGANGVTGVTSELRTMQGNTGRFTARQHCLATLEEGSLTGMGG